MSDQSYLWPNIRKTFYDDLERMHEKTGPWDAVLFTGDLVQSGSEAEFNALEEKVLTPLWDHFAKIGSNKPNLLAVPGNHDLVRPDQTKPKAALRALLKSDAFAEFEDDFWSDRYCEYREIVSAAFANFQKWSEKNARIDNIIFRQGELPGDFAATLHLDPRLSSYE